MATIEERRQAAKEQSRRQIEKNKARQAELDAGQKVKDAVREAQKDALDDAKEAGAGSATFRDGNMDVTVEKGTVEVAGRENVVPTAEEIIAAIDATETGPLQALPAGFAVDVEGEVTGLNDAVADLLANAQVKVEGQGEEE